MICPKTTLAWTEGYRPFILGGKCHYFFRAEIPVTGVVPLGRGYFALTIVSPRGTTYYVCGVSGGLLGTDLEQIKTDVKKGEKKVMDEQLRDMKNKGINETEVVSAAEFWRLLRG
jgi:hypothetical protein